MQVSDVDIRRTARLLIQKHGDQAAVVAGLNAARLRLRGNIAGKTLWLRVVQAIGDLNTAQPETAASERAS